jgi:hypothetical protein
MLLDLGSERKEARLVVMMEPKEREVYFRNCQKLGKTPSEVTRLLIRQFNIGDVNNGNSATGNRRKRASATS